MFAVTTLKNAGAAGHGVFARRDLEPGEAIFIETEQSRDKRKSWTPEEVEALPERIQSRVHHFGFELPNGDLAVMPWIKDYVTGVRDDIPWEDRPDNGEFFNHCCDPNAWWEDDYRLVARRRIPAGTEITYDYCTEDMEVAGFDCACGAATCRKRVSSSDWARPDMWAAYNTHWKSHILAEITALQAKQAKASPAGPTPVPVLASPLLSSSSSAAACGGLETLASSPTAGNKVVIPPAALNWTADPTASAANAGGRNRSSSAGAAGDEANTDASTSASELASEAASMEEAASVGSVSDGEAPTALAVA